MWFDSRFDMYDVSKLISMENFWTCFSPCWQYSLFWRWGLLKFSSRVSRVLDTYSFTHLCTWQWCDFKSIDEFYDKLGTIVKLKIKLCIVLCIRRGCVWSVMFGVKWSQWTTLGRIRTTMFRALSARWPLRRTNTRWDEATSHSTIWEQNWKEVQTFQIHCFKDNLTMISHNRNYVWKLSGNRNPC